MADQPDQILLRSLQQGDKDAIGFFIDRYQTMLFNFAYRFLNDYDLASDVCQFAFIQLFLHSADLRSEEGVKPWLFRVVRHRCLDEVRRRKALPFSMLDSASEHDDRMLGMESVPDSQPTPEARVEEDELQAVLISAINALPEKFREVVRLRYTADLSFAEIGKILDIPEATAKTHFHRAKPLLRATLQQYGLARP